MRNRFEKKPALFITILFALVSGIFTSLIYVRGDNYFAEASYICTFMLVIAISGYFFESKRCVHIILTSLIGGALGGIVYWYAQSDKPELLQVTMYGALIGLAWVIIDGMASNESCT